MTDLWKWERLLDAGIEHGSVTYRMKVPGGWLIHIGIEARQGRGPEYAAHPIPTSLSMVFVPNPDAANERAAETMKSFGGSLPHWTKPEESK